MFFIVLSFLDETTPLEQGLKLPRRFTDTSQPSLDETTPLEQGLKRLFRRICAPRERELDETTPLEQGLKHHKFVCFFPNFVNLTKPLH